MIAALADTLDWVEEMREDLRDNLPAARRGCHGPAPQFDWAACGTPAQYRKHLRQKIPTCEPCRQAECRRQADCRQGKSSKRSKQTAWLSEFNRMIEKVNADLRSRA